MNLWDKIFLMRALLGITAGLLSGLLGFVTPSMEAYRGLAVGLLLYLISYYVSKYIAGERVHGPEGRRVLTTGIGTYIMLFLFTWILYNTLLLTLSRNYV